MTGLHFMKWYPGDFMKSTRGWSVTAKGVYRELLDAQWDMGGLPGDPNELRALIGATESEWAEGWKRCESKFPSDADGQRRNRRLEEHRAEAGRRHEERVETGSKGGKASAARRKASSSSAPTSAQAELQPQLKHSRSQKSEVRDQNPDIQSSEPEHTQNARTRANGAAAPRVCTDRAFDDERFAKLKAIYPVFSGRQNWTAAKKACVKLVSTGKATWEALEAGVTRLRAYVDAGGYSGPECVIRPHTFFGADDKPWEQPWELTDLQRLTLEHKRRDDEARR